ncbi:hypothetical protein D9M72_401940 [compost metagenome]
MSRVGRYRIASRRMASSTSGGVVTSTLSMMSTSSGADFCTPNAICMGSSFEVATILTSRS